MTTSPAVIAATTIIHKKMSALPNSPEMLRLKAAAVGAEALKQMAMCVLSSISGSPHTHDSSVMEVTCLRMLSCRTIRGSPSSAAPALLAASSAEASVIVPKVTLPSAVPADLSPEATLVTTIPHTHLIVCPDSDRMMLFSSSGFVERGTISLFSRSANRSDTIRIWHGCALMAQSSAFVRARAIASGHSPGLVLRTAGTSFLCSSTARVLNL
mmetsp:Transcript_28325/g.70122  ORF Transcript_28325/g.70122 Transcript_28325/m.70122 type:complete len:213 (-) Transcript_28325:113-751(-)